MGTSHQLAAVVAGGMMVGAAILGGCSGGDDGAKATATSVPSNVTSVPATTAAPTESGHATKAVAEAVEVQGVVGAVNTQTRIIEIRPTSGGSYSLIQVEATTKIRRAGGGAGQFSQIRSSDRILAVGVAGDDPDTLIAAEITIQQVVPGSQPGG